MFLEDAVDHHLLGELPVVVEGTVDVAAEIAGDVEELGLALDGEFVRPAGEVEGEAAPPQVLQQRPGGVNEQFVGGDGAVGQPGVRAPMCRPAGAGTRACTTAVRSARPRAPDPLGELDHLVDRLLAVEPHDVVEDHLRELGLGLAGQARSASTNIGTITSGHP